MRDLALARAYRHNGFSLGGVLLKQSLYPGDLFGRLLDGAGPVLDLGCGEGLLTNLLARRLPRARFVGIDLDADKIAAARLCAAAGSTEFRTGSFFDHPFRDAHAVIFNDVLHHLAPERQLAALRHAANCLDDQGVIILKEVDPADRLDVRHTTFWDSRLYPADQLHFIPPGEWIARLQALGFRHLGTATVRHPWIASRTLLWFTRRPKLAGFAPPLPATGAIPAKTVLVTGGSGFIGEWVVRQLLAVGLGGDAVRVDLVVRRPPAVAPDIAAHARVRILAGNLTDAAFTASIAGPYDAVFHLAAIVDYFGGVAVHANNLQATTNLLTACARWRPARFVYTSTMGALDRSRWDLGGAPLDESSPHHPTSPYGRAKVAEEELVRKSGFDWTIARLPWCYGPGMAESHHVRNLLGRVRRDAALCRLHWPGRVSVVEVREAARQLVALPGNPRAVRATFFLAEEEPAAFGQLFAEMGRIVGRPAAGSLRLPRWFRRVLRPLLPLAPFQLKCLLTDALVVSTDNARRLGVTTAQRAGNYLLPLSRYDANQIFPSRHRASVLITGAAGGIGASLSRQFHAAGHALILADRNAAALHGLCRETAAEAWVVDLADPALPALLPEIFPSRHPWPAVVVNNAGAGWRGTSWLNSAEQFGQIVAVNATAPATVASFFLRNAPAPVTIINITSTAALQPLPHMAAYAAAKSFALSFSLALAAEVRAHGRGDQVLTVIPAGTQTGFQAAAGVKTNPKEKLLSPDTVAAAIVAALDRRRTLRFIGSSARAMRLAAAVVPLRWQGRLWEKLMRTLR